MAGPLRRTDGVVVLRSPAADDAEALRAGRDDAFYRWLGPGDEEPNPVACIVVQGRVVGWIDYDSDRPWLHGDQVNIGYNVFPCDRHHGYASRALELLIEHLRDETSFRTASLLIATNNVASLAVAARCGFRQVGLINGSHYFERAVHSDGD